MVFGSVPATSSAHHVRSDQIADAIDCKIKGGEMQFVEIERVPGEPAIAEAGAMMFKAPAVTMYTVFGGSSGQSSGFMGKRVGAGNRLVIGESLFTTVFMRAAARPASPLPLPTADISWRSSAMRLHAGRIRRSARWRRIGKKTELSSGNPIPIWGKSSWSPPSDETEPESPVAGCIAKTDPWPCR